MAALNLTRPELGGHERPINIFTTLAHHPALLAPFLQLGNQILFNSLLDPRDRQLLILRTGYLCRSKYEWAHHAIISKRVGLTDVEIARVQQGPDAAGWSQRQIALLRAADELHADQMVDPATWEALAAHYDTQHLIEVTTVVGLYTLISMLLNTFGVQLDPGISCDVEFSG